MFTQRASVQGEPEEQLQEVGSGVVGLKVRVGVRTLISLISPL